MFVEADEGSIELALGRFLATRPLANVASEFERVITYENVPDVTSHVLLKEILSFIVVAEKQMHELVVAWERVKNVLIKSILNVRRAAFPVGLIKMTSNVLTEVQRANTLGN